MGPNELFMVVCFFIEIIVIPFIGIFILFPKLFKPSTCSSIIRFIFIYMGINLFLAFSNFGYGCIKRSRTPSRVKACLSNIRVLQCAVEMYNMDNEKEPMTTLDIETLKNNRYLKPDAIVKPEKECEYLSNNDLSKDGEVVCRLHSDPKHYEEWGLRNPKEKTFWDSSFGKFLENSWHSPIGILFRALFLPTSLPFLLP